MTRPRRPLRNDGIILPPADFIGGKDRLIVRHENGPEHQRTFGAVIMAPAGLELLNSQMRHLDKAILKALISKLQWFEIDYEATKSGRDWELHFADDGKQIIARIKESGIATTGLTQDDMVDLIYGNSDQLLDLLAEAHSAILGIPIDRDRANRHLNASKKSRYRINQVRRSLSNLKALGVIIGREHAGPNRHYYILNPFLYCAGPTFMRNALIRHFTNPDTGGVVHFSDDLSNAGPPKRRKTNADLVRELSSKDGFINDVLENGELPEEMRQRGHRLLDGSDSGEDGEHTPQGSKEER